MESTANRPFASAAGADAYPHLVQKAIALFHSLICDHPFQDGNKRTAVIAPNHFLLWNSYRQIISNGAMYEVAKKTASYRERGLSNEDSLQEIWNILAPMVLPLDALKIMRLKAPAE